MRFFYLNTDVFCFFCFVGIVHGRGSVVCFGCGWLREIQQKQSGEYQQHLSSDSNFPALSLHILSLSLSLSLFVIGWGGWWHITSRGGWTIKPLYSLSSDTDNLAPYWALLNSNLSTTKPKHHPYQLQPAAMCKGLASLPTCCLERYIKLLANTDVWGFGLDDREQLFLYHCTSACEHLRS